MSKSRSSSSWIIGFTILLTIVFIALKLFGVINWLWWWVLSPLVIGIAIVILILGGAFCVFLYKEYRTYKSNANT